MSIIPQLHSSPQQVWVTLLLFTCLLLFAWVRITNPKKLPSLVIGFFKGSVTEEKTISPDAIALFFIFICSAALLLVQGFQFHNIKTRFSYAEEFLLMATLLLAYYFLKTLALLICGNIFKVELNARDYISEIYASAHLAGLLLFPAALILTFIHNINHDIFEKGILVVFLLLFVYRTVKMFILMMNKGLRMMYLFLYLCTLEIIPVVLLIEFGKGLNL